MQHFGLLGANRLAPGRRWRLHGQVAHDLQQMVLDDIANHADFFIKASAAGDVEILGHRHLHTLDVMAVPDRLQKRIGEAEVHDVLHCLFAEVVIDAEDRLFGKDLPQHVVERARGIEIAPERFFDHHARALRAAGSREVFDHRRKRAGRDRQVKQRPARGAGRIGRRLAAGPRHHQLVAR